LVNNNVPHIGNTPNVRPRAAEKANCFGSAPLKKKGQSYLSTAVFTTPA